MKQGIDIIDSEYLTRKQKIDRLLRQSGWTIVQYKKEMDLKDYSDVAVKEFPTKSGPSDYVLFDNGFPIAIIEAKKGALGVYSVLDEAQRYSRNIDTPFQFGEYHVPFIYSSNGEKIFFQDLRDSQSYSREVAGFHTLNALQEILSDKQQEGLEWMKKNQKLNPKTRPYQIEAVFSVEKALFEKKRKLLMAMATGTGKTFTTVQIIYRLMKSGYGKRILFLVDRRALAVQAVKEFSTFEAEPEKKFDKLYEVYSQRFKREDFDDEKFDPKVMPPNYLKNPKIGQAFVYVCTIQRMRINLFGKDKAFEETDPEIEEDAEKIDIPIHAFDIIIADECHRGYTSAEVSKWREVLNYFDAEKIGLTATPATHTTSFFEHIVFRYDYSRAVREGYLVDFDPVAIHSNIKIRGLFLKENEQVGIVDVATGIEKLDNVEDEREFEVNKIEREITSPDSTKKIIEELSKHILEQEKKTGRFPKTLIFAVNDLPHVSHADRIIKLCRDTFQRGDAFVQKITGTVDRPLQKIREFRNRPEPGIVVTVDMLSTGIDIPSLENIVFLRPVQSRILFAQMLGRGTRRCDAIGKDHFTVYDCFGGSLLNYFSKATDLTIDPPDKFSKTNEEIIDDIYKNRDRAYNETCLVKRLQRIAKNMSGEAFEEFAPYIKDGDIGRFAQNLQSMLASDFSSTIKILRDKGFQNILLSYPRKQKVFLIAYDSRDNVTSEYLFKTTDGKEINAGDYIEAFTKFVRENPEKIDAIKILLERPVDWNTDALHEIRIKLRKNPYKFTEDNLRKAYQNELADIISIIKHAANDEPLLSAEERVEKAMARVIQGQTFTEQQKQWLSMIKNHLIKNLAIEKRDFEKIPIFARQGGWGRANKEFGGNIDKLLKRINEEVAR